MLHTSTERQRKFKAKLYGAGLTQIALWVKKKETKKAGVMTQKEFLTSLNKLAKGWDEESLSNAYKLFIEIIRGKKEAAKHIR